MNLATAIDVAIGLTVVYLGASLFVTIVNEFFNQLLHRRARQLTRDLRALIDCGDVRGKLRDASPLLARLFDHEQAKGPQGSSYIDPGQLAEQLVGALRTTDGAVVKLSELGESLRHLPESKMRKQLLALFALSGDRLERFVGRVEVWIDDSLTALGEAYKRRTQWMSLILGLLVAIAFNLDTLGLVGRLYTDHEARDAVASLADSFVDQLGDEDLAACTSGAQPAEAPECAAVDHLLDALQKRNDALASLPIGWDPSGDGVLATISNRWSWTMPFGWLLTGLAASLGAPLWFDLLNKLINIRHGMGRPEPPEPDDEGRAGRGNGALAPSGA